MLETEIMQQLSPEQRALIESIEESNKALARLVCREIESVFYESDESIEINENESISVIFRRCEILSKLVKFESYEDLRDLWRSF